MKDLVRNGTFEGIDGWVTDGEAFSVNTADGLRVKLRAPKISVNGTRNVTQNLPKSVPSGHTLYLRFKASGNVRIGIQLRETMNEAQKLIATSIARPGDDVTGGLKQYAYAVRARRGYGPEQLQISFSFGNDPGEARITEVELYDQDLTNPATLPQTEMLGGQPQVLSSRPVAKPLPTLGKAPAPAAAPEPAPAPAPVENNVNFLRQPTNNTPAASVPLIENGDFANGDQNWQAWGENVAANMADGWLKLQLNNADGSKAADAGMNQPIKTAVKAGDTISVRMKVKGNVHLLVHLEETKAPFRNVVTRTFQAKPEGEEILLVGRAESDWAPGDLRFEIQMGQDKGELSISNIQVSKQSAAF